MAQLKLSEAMSINMALTAVKLERVRQIEEEGYTAAHDDAHCNGELAKAAAAYAIISAEFLPNARANRHEEAEALWPWYGAFNPKAPRQDLVRAAALLIAEIERIDRLPDNLKG